MARHTWIAWWSAVCAIVAPTISGQEPPARPALKVEFRWLEAKPVKDLTEEKGVRMTCAGDLWYPHKKPVLGNKDVARASLHKHFVSLPGYDGMGYTVKMYFTDQATKTLEKSSGNEPTRVLAGFIEGEFRTASRFERDRSAECVPAVGLIPRKSDAERIVEAFQSGASREGARETTPETN